jgi:hypothetical protein
MTIGLQGFFTIKIRQPCGTIRREYRFPNLILDNGLDGIGTNGLSWMQTIALGTDSTPPNASQIGLISLGPSTTTSNAGTTGFVAGPPPYGWFRESKRFAAGTATGTWSEVGIGRTGSNLWSRSLILDGGGSPLPITVLAIEIVDIEYELRMYRDITDATGTRTISGVDYDYIMRPAGLVSYSNCPARNLVDGTWMTTGSGAGKYIYDGAIGLYTGAPSGLSAFDYQESSVAAYSAGTYTKTTTFNWSIDNGNVSGGAKSFYGATFYNVTNIVRHQIEFDPVIPKNNTRTLSLTVSETWARRP